MQQGTCERCGAEFDRTQPRKRYCSDRCQRIASKRRERMRNTERAKCKHCGLGFQRPKQDGRRKVYCSLACQYEARSMSYRERDDIGRDPERTLGRYYAALRADLCAYCGSRGGEIDHIEARSTGGANHWENYTGACARCNMSKGNKPLVSFLGWRSAAVVFDGWRSMLGRDDLDTRAGEAALVTVNQGTPL